MTDISMAIFALNDQRNEVLDMLTEYRAREDHNCGVPGVGYRSNDYQRLVGEHEGLSRAITTLAKLL